MSLYKTAAALGLYRVTLLNDNDKRILREEYGLPDDADLGARAYAREKVVGGLGTLAGTALGAAMAVRHPGLAKALSPRKAVGVLLGRHGATNEISDKMADDFGRVILTGASGLAGGLTAAKLVTDKYSKSAVEDIMKRRAEKERKE